MRRGYSYGSVFQAARLRPSFNDTADYLFLQSNFGM